MSELFRLRIAAKRQTTVPQRLMNVLGLTEGDELRVTVEDNEITKVVPFTSIPAHFVTGELAEAIEESRRELREGKTGDADALAKRLQRGVAEGQAVRTVLMKEGTIAAKTPAVRTARG